MYTCPVCKDELRWNADQDDGERAWGDYSCDDCRVDVQILICDYSEEENEDDDEDEE